MCVSVYYSCREQTRKGDTTMTIEKVLVNLNTGEQKILRAELSQTPSDIFHTYTLTYECYQSDWKEVA